MVAERYPALRAFAEAPSGADPVLIAKRREAKAALAELDRLRAQVAGFVEEVDHMVAAIGRRDAALLRVQQRLLARVHVGFATKLDSGWWLRSGSERPEGAGWVHVYVDALDLGEVKMPTRKWRIDRDGDHVTITFQVEGDVLEAGHRTIKLTQLRFPLEDLDTIQVLLSGIDRDEVPEH